MSDIGAVDEMAPSQSAWVTVRLRLGDGLIHDHVHVLRIAWDSSPLRLVRRRRPVLMTALRCLWRRVRGVAGVRLPALLRLSLPDQIGKLFFTVNRRAEAAPESWREVPGQSVTIPDDAQAFIHAHAGLRPKSCRRHR